MQTINQLKLNNYETVFHVGYLRESPATTQRLYELADEYYKLNNILIQEENIKSLKSKYDEIVSNYKGSAIVPIYRLNYFGASNPHIEIGRQNTDDYSVIISFWLIKGEYKDGVIENYLL